jgi:hypothetical protein
MSDGGGSLTRDVLLRVRAQNLSTADFQQVTASVNQLTAALDKQIEAASRGEIKERELTASLNKLSQAADNLKSLSGTIEIFKGFETRIAAAQAAVEKSRTSITAYQAELAKSETVTARAAERLNVLTRAHDREAATLTKLQGDQAKYAESLEKAGVDTANLAASEQQLLTVAEQIGAARTRLGAAQEGYAESVRKTTAALKTQQDAERAAAQAAQVRLTESRRLAEESAKAAKAALADQQKAQAEADAAATKAREAQIADEKKMAHDRAELVKQVGRQTQDYNQPRYAAIKENLEKELKIREAAVEAERRQSIGLTGRLKEDLTARVRAQQQYVQEYLAGHRQQQAATTQTEAVAQKAAAGVDALGRRGRGEGAATTILGFKPYEITNLGYQFNDVVSGLAQGQPAFQVFTQQIGQIVQIVGTRLLPVLPVAAAAVAAFTVTIGALSRALGELASNREFAGAITFNASAIGYSNTQLTELRKTIQNLGASWEDAGKVIRTAIDFNISQGRIKEFGQAAVDVARVLGTEIPEAAKQLAEGLSGGDEGVSKLQASLQVLSDGERKRIRDLFEAGKAEEARALTLDIVSRRAHDAAEAMRTPWEKAVLAMGNAWRNFLDTIKNSPAIQTLVGWIGDAIDGMTKLIREIDKLTDRLGKLQSFGEFDKKFTEKFMEKAFGSDIAAAGRLWDKISGVVDKLRGVESKPGGATAPVPPAGGDASVGTPGGTARFSTGGLAVNSDEIRALTNLLSEASKQLPEGYTVRATSIYRPGAIVAGTNTPSEHGFNRAIDTEIYDAAGKAVAGAMGEGGPLYRVMDQAVLAAAAKAGVGPVAIGSTFGKPDAGHYSIGGREAANNAARRGDTTTGAVPATAPSGPVTTGPTAKQKEDAEKALRDEKERLAIIQAATDAEEMRTKTIQFQREASDRGGTQDQQNQYVITKQTELQLEQTVRRLNLERERGKEAIDDARHLTEIRAAGDKAVAELQAAGVTGRDRVDAARKAGEAAERDRLSRLDAEKDRLVSLEKAYAGLQRGLDAKHATELARALAEVDDQYKSIYEQLKKDQELATPATRTQLEEFRVRLDAQREVQRAEATRKSYESQAKVSLETRADLIKSYERVYEAGDISIAEKEAKVKAAFDATTPSILAAASALEAYLKTAEGLKLPPLEIERIKAKVAELRAETKYVDPLFKELKKTIEDSFGRNLETAFNTVGEALGKLVAKTATMKDVFIAVQSAAAQFFSSLLKDIAGAILKYEALRLVQSLGFTSGSGGGLLASVLGIGSQTGAAAATAGATAATAGAEGATAAAAGAAAGPGLISRIFSSIFHEGGIVGAGGLVREVPASWFAGAPRYHNGGMVGLAANENAAILQRGEEVLAANNPRHARNWQGGGPDINIRNVLVADPDLVPSHMGSLKGERVIMNVLTKNAATVRQLVR